MKLSDAYEFEYDRLVAHLASHCAEMPESVCLHWPLAEPTYQGGLLAIGQALNGWIQDESTCHLWRPETRKTALAATRAASESPTAWRWMRPRPWGRPFWRLVRHAMGLRGLTLNQIAWSNLAKVAPGAGQNPEGALLERQRNRGGRLLRMEVDELDPELVLLVSGRGYAGPFLDAAGYVIRWQPDKALQFDGIIDGRRWLIVNHPGTFASRFEESFEAVQRALG